MVDIKDQLKSAPYFDDYSEKDGYYRMLFRPRFAVQARELTQMQTMFQTQISRMGRHFFKEGSLVIPGTCNYDTNYTYVKVYINQTIDNSIYFTDDVAIRNNFIGKVITSQSGVKARIINYTEPDLNGIIRLYVKYNQAGENNNGSAVKRFQASEELTVDDSGIVLETISDSALVTGTGTGATIKEGVYFTNGFFAIVLEQAIVIDPEGTTPSISIGLNVLTTIVTPEEDEALLDNAQGSPNYAAPGAHRLKIELVLSTRPIDRITTGELTNTEFIELIRLNNGLAAEPPNRTDYNILRDEMARRTYDESGNYVLKPFVTVAHEFLNDGTNNGYYTLDMLKRSTSNAANDVGEKLLGITGSHPFGDYFLPGNSESEFLAAANSKLAYLIEPGKAYVQGYEIEKLDRSVTIGRKAIDTTIAKPNIIKTMRGPFFKITNIKGLPALAWGEARDVNPSFAKILLFSRKREFLESPSGIPIAPGSSTLSGAPLTLNESSPYCIGVARGIFLEYDSGVPGNEKASYLLHVSDVKITNPDYNIEHIQSMYQTPIGGVISTVGFSCDTFQYSLPLLGATVSCAVANFGKKQIEAKNAYWKTLADQRISINDNLVVGSAAENNIIYLYAAAPALNNQTISVTSSSNDTFTDLEISKLYTQLEEQDSGTLLYPLPNGYVNNVDLQSVDYITQKLFVETSTANQITITIPSGEGIVTSYSQTEWFFCNAAGVQLRPISVVNNTSTQVTVTFDTISNQPIVAIIPVRMSGQNSVTKRDKIYRQGIYQNTGTPSGQHYLTTPINVTPPQTISLGVSDVIRITAIYMAGDFSTDPTPNDPNIMDRYELDNGQRDTYYGIAEIKLKRGAQVPTGRITIVYDWFEHTTDGSYFCINSYPLGPGFDISDIPTYTSVDSGRKYFLADVFDFRSTKSLSGDINEKLSYLPDGDIFAGYTHFLHRKDKLYITPQGEFRILEGIPSLKPTLPPDPVDGMVSAELNLPALTRSSKDVVISHRNNRRYTMRDIGKIEQRIDQIEYYTSLSLLETNTEKLVIKDAQGNDRFKNGFMVDNFRGHATGDTINIDYSCAVDPNLGILRPAIVERGVELLEVKPYEVNLLGFTGIENETDRTNANYTKKGDIILLNYETVDAKNMQQLYATDFVNVNPFEVISFIGRCQLTPSSDEFKSTELVPERIVDLDTGLANALTDLSKGLGTVYTFDSVKFNTQSSEPVITTDTIQSPPIPAAAWHVNEDGSLGVPNELATQLANRQSAREKLAKKEKLIKTLKGELKSAKDKKTKKGLKNKIKAIQDDIAELKPQASLQNPPQPNFPSLYIQGERTQTNKSVTANGGKKINVKQTDIKTSLGGSVVSINFAEFCRSQIVEFSLQGLAPGSKIYAFIDGIPVTHFCIPKSAANEIMMPACERSPAPFSFFKRFHEPAGGTNNGIFPIISGSGATGYVVFDPTPTTGINATNVAYSLTVDSVGSLNGYLFIPNGLPVNIESGEKLKDSALNPKFKTGEKLIRFTDSPQNIISESDTSCNVKFQCQGLIEKKQNTIVSTKGAEVAVEFANEETKVITDLKETNYKLSYATWNDPIAETITCEEPGGMFVTGVTVYFRNKPYKGPSGKSINFHTRDNIANAPLNPVVPISVEIRENAVGFPGPLTLPGSRVFLYPNQIVINDVANDVDPQKGDNGDRSTGQLFISIPSSNVFDDTNAAIHQHYPNAVTGYTSFSSDGKYINGGGNVVEANMPVWNPKTRTLAGTMPESTEHAGFVGTYFEFDYPIYLQEKTEYSIVIRANSQNYEVWYARIGQYKMGENVILNTTGNYNGVFLKSANSSTWTPDQEADLMFKMHKAQFPTNVTGEVTFVNQDGSFDKLENNPFKIEAGSNTIKVYHKNHGLRNRQSAEQKPRIKIMGVSSSVGGIDPIYINTESTDSVNKWHDVTVLDFDTYSFQVFDGNAKPLDSTETIYRTGGSTIFTTSDIQVDEMLINISNITFDDTNIDYSYRICSGNGVHGLTFEPYVLPTINDFIAFQPGQQIIFDEPKLICGIANEGRWNYLDNSVNGIMDTPGSALGSSKSLFVTASLSTDNPNVSPIIDLGKTNALIIGNKVSDPGLVNEYKAFTEPNDLVFFGFKDCGVVTSISGVNLIVIDGTKFHVNGYVKLIDQDNKPHIRKIISISGNALTLDSVFPTSVTGGTAHSSGLNFWSFGDVPEDVTSGITLSISGDTFASTDPVVISVLAEVFQGTLIKIIDSTSAEIVTRIISVIRTSSTDITVRTESDLSTLVGPFSIKVYNDVLTCYGSGATDAPLARSIGKAFLASMQEGQYIKVINTTSNKNDATYEIVRIKEVIDDTGVEYKLLVEVNYDIDEDVAPQNVTIVGIEDFYSLESPVRGTSPCSYITKRMILANPCTALKVKFLANVRNDQNLQVFAKFSGLSTTESFDNARYEELTPVNGKVPAFASDDNIFHDYEYESEFLTPFTQVAIKITLQGTDSTKPIKVQDLQVIALDS
jgi:hypothetical protein